MIAELTKQDTKSNTEFTYNRKSNKKIEYAVIVHPFTYKYPTYTLPPITAEYAQAAFERMGIKTDLFDMRFEEDIRSALKKADIVCVFGHSEITPLFTLPSHHLIPEILNFIPEEIPVIAGGTGFMNAEETFQAHNKIDILIVGSPEKSISDILEGKELTSVSNLICKTENGKLIHTPKFLNQLSETIFPIRKLRNQKYNYHIGGLKIDLIRTAVGCNYKCKFCYEYGKDLEGNYSRWNDRSVESLLQEIKETDADIIGLVDDDFLTDMEKIEKLCDLLIQNKIKKHFIGVGRIDHIVKAGLPVLKKMEKAGFIAISVGIESLKDETLSLYKKGLNLSKIQAGIQLMNQTNILIQCTFLIGSPGETEDDMLKILDFSRKWNIDSVGTNRIRVPENSPLYEIISDKENKQILEKYKMITGDELARIKYKIKFGQRTPLKIALTILKLYKHKGMHFDPIFLVLSALQEFSKGMFIDRFFLTRYSLKFIKNIFGNPLIHKTIKASSYILYPIVFYFNKGFEMIDKKLNISIRLMPFVLNYVNHKLYYKQRENIQINGFMQKLNNRKKEYIC